jgi:peptidoglycan/LPS O-acetylase OafA/YrhL
VVSAWLAQRGQLDRQAPRWLAGAAWVLAGGCFVLVAKGLDLPTNPIAHRTDAQYLLEQLVRGGAAMLFVVPAVFAARRKGAIRRFLSTRVMIWLGLVSYGIYLWHEASLTIYLRWRGFAYGGNGRLLEFLAFCLVTTIPIAALSYYLIERPALRLKTRRLPGRARRSPARQPT